MALGEGYRVCVLCIAYPVMVICRFYDISHDISVVGGVKVIPANPCNLLFCLLFFFR